MPFESFKQFCEFCDYAYTGPFLNGFWVLFIAPIVMVVLFLILINQVGSGLGLAKLFRFDGGSIFARLFIGMGCAVVYWLGLYAGYLYEPLATSYSKDYPPWKDKWCVANAADVSLFLGYAATMLTCLAVSGLALWNLLTALDVLGRKCAAPTSASGLGRTTAEQPPGRVQQFVIGLLWFLLIGGLFSASLFADMFVKSLRNTLVPVVAAIAFGGLLIRGGWWCYCFASKPSSSNSSSPRERIVLSSGWFLAGVMLGLIFLCSMTSMLFHSSLCKPMTTSIGRKVVDYAGYGEAAAREKIKEINKDRFIHAYHTEGLSEEQFQRLFQSRTIPTGEDGKSIPSPKTGVQADRFRDLDLEQGEGASLVFREVAMEGYAGYFVVYGVFFLLVGLVLLVFILNYFVWIFWKPGVFSPAVGIVLLMNLLIIQDVTIRFFTPYPALVKAGGIILILFLYGLRIYRLKFRGLDYTSPVSLLYNKPEPPQAESPPIPQPTLRNETPLKPWHPKDQAGQKFPLVVICASGGGSRAAAWTTAVMGQLEREMEKHGILLPYHTKLVTGASGGMLGMANYLVNLAAPHADTKVAHHEGWEPLPGGTRSDIYPWLNHTKITKDWLTPICHRLLFFDIPSLFLPWQPPALKDRGIALEDEWMRELGTRFGVSFQDLLGEPNAECWRPQMIFSPMIVEDGRQLLISNLDLDRTLRYTASTLGDSNNLLSRPGVEFFKLFEGKSDHFRVATAARMSASFPYLLPASTLPTVPPRRVVDAGYYDNYGVQVAGAWLTAYREWIKANFSGVLFIQIRDSLSVKARRMETIDPSDTSSLAWRSLQWLSSPFSGLLSARTSSNSFRNDNLLDLVDRLYSQLAGPDFFRVASFEFSLDNEVCLSFRLTEQEICDIATEAAHLNEKHPIIAETIEWWHSRMASARSRST